MNIRALLILVLVFMLVSVSGMFPEKALHIDQNGNIGIGMTDPAFRLDVAGDINFSGNLYQNGTLFSGGGASGWSKSGSNLYYNSGNVGIGTQSPAQKLVSIGDISFAGSDTTATNSNKNFRIASLSYNTAEEPVAVISTASTLTGSTLSIGGGSTLLNAVTRLEFYSASAPNLVNGTSRMVIDANGYVGIGVASPYKELHVNGGLYGTVIVQGIKSSGIWFSNGNAHDIGRLHYDHANNSISLYANGNERLKIDSSGNVGIGILTADYRLTLKGSGNNNLIKGQNWNNTNTIFTIDGMNGNGLFSLFDNSQVLKVSINANGNTFFNGGNFGIGVNNPSYLLQVNGDAAKPGGGSWASASDIRLKDIYGSYTKGLTEIMKIQPIYYSYKNGNPLGLPSGGKYVGVSAQDIAMSVPEAVGDYGKGYLSVNNDPIIWTMLNAIKELKEENDLLKERIGDLEEKRSLQK